MTVDKRDRRNETGSGQRAPRSGGPDRGAAGHARGQGHAAGEPGGGRPARGGAREFPTQGTAALRPAARADSASPPRLRVAPPVPVSVPRAPFAALVVVLVVGGVLGILLINTKINENSFHLKQLQEQQVDLNLQQQQLNRQITDAKAPGNLVDAARKLGLVEVGEPGYIQLPDGGEAISVPQPAGTGQQGTGG
ncbi:hypothetical protein HCB18_25410 [Salinispora arenicola]|nr:hypothetical protein [Salinispora arenicola]